MCVCVSGCMCGGGGGRGAERGGKGEENCFKQVCFIVKMSDSSGSPLLAKVYDLFYKIERVKMIG